MTFPFVFFKFIPLQIVISFCRFFLFFITVSVIIIPTASAQASTDGLKELLQDLSNVSVKLNDMNHSNDIISSEWLGASPCTLEDIRNTEQRLGITLPEDLKSFYLTSNGFLQPSYTQTSVFPIAKVTRLDIEEYLGYNILKYYPRDFVNKLKSAFIIGDGDNKHQYLLLVPDTNQKSKWIYMKYGSWMGGESYYETITDYFGIMFETTESLFIRKINEPYFDKDKFLRELLTCNWSVVFNMSKTLLLNNTSYYTGSYDEILRTMLLCCNKMNTLDSFDIFIHSQDLIDKHGKQYSTWIDTKFKERHQPYFRKSKYNSYTLFWNTNKVKDLSVYIDTIKSSPIMQDVKKDSLYIITLNHYVLFNLFNDRHYLDYITVYQKGILAGTLTPQTHLQAAIIYAKLHKHQEVFNSIRRYYEFGNDNPMNPFLIKELVPYMTKQNLSKIYSLLKQKHFIK